MTLVAVNIRAFHAHFNAYENNEKWFSRITRMWTSSLVISSEFLFSLIVSCFMTDRRAINLIYLVVGGNSNDHKWIHQHLKEFLIRIQFKQINGFNFLLDTNWYYWNSNIETKENDNNNNSPLFFYHIYRKLNLNYNYSLSNWIHIGFYFGIVRLLAVCLSCLAKVIYCISRITIHLHRKRN